MIQYGNIQTFVSLNLAGTQLSFMENPKSLADNVNGLNNRGDGRYSTLSYRHRRRWRLPDVTTSAHAMSPGRYPGRCTDVSGSGDSASARITSGYDLAIVLQCNISMHH